MRRWRRPSETAGLLKAIGGVPRVRDSRLYTLLHGLEPETVAYVRLRGSRRVRERVDRFITRVAPVRLAVSGKDLERLGVEAGPAYSAILAQVLADRLDGIAVGREAELADLWRLARKAGLIDAGENGESGT